MEGETHKGLVLSQFKKMPVYQDFPKPKPAPGQLLVQVEASTINPSDRLRSDGAYFPVALPATMGLEGTGKVVEANGEDIQSWVGKRICYTQAGHGTWAEFTVTTPDSAFPIDEDVPLHCAASGIVNPLTAVGFVDVFENYEGKKGIIHTAAASSLGRMLNKLCQSKKIPLLNIVRRKEHEDILRKQGAEHVIVTSEGWQDKYKEAIKAHGFNVFFDALGGGPTTETLIMQMNPGSTCYIYGALEAKPLTIQMGISLSKGVSVTGFILFGWWSKLSAEKKKAIKDSYSSLLKGDLKTNPFKTLKFSEIEEGYSLSVSKASEGKITLIPK